MSDLRELGRTGLRVTNTLEALDRLTERGAIDGERGERLRESYGFLRRLIDALRIVRGHAKDLTIPPTASREFAYLAQRLRYASAAALHEAITTRMTFARDLWQEGPPPSG